eukprot:CAMPEP_0178935566 /NCGR_PEP_ID=MMETSP0786-20121207/24627_1 /TAXON_ID=186022 /ORGANISM="Thalassionema frauenfeldii, Strain CCMP 1798" /LENGTH=416 /DNA_ID=CAMNT_0020613749 /DNA_START=29 /DNA_END=1277 /DNA_ORIENTATION=-
MTEADTTNPNPSGALVKAVLMNVAIPEGVGDGDGPQTLQPYDVHQNYGRISLVHSLYLPHKSYVQIQVWDRVEISNQRVWEEEVTIDESRGCSSREGGLSVTLVWMDAPGHIGCRSQCLVNDLDLLVLKYTGEEAYQYFPNGNYDQPDRVNNVERVQIGNVQDGEVYTIEVRAHNLDVERTQFAVVATGCFGGVGSTLDYANRDVYLNDNSASTRRWILIGTCIGGGILLLLLCLLPWCIRWCVRRRRRRRQRQLRKEYELGDDDDEEEEHNNMMLDEQPPPAHNDDEAGGTEDKTEQDNDAAIFKHSSSQETNVPAKYYDEEETTTTTTTTTNDATTKKEEAENNNEWVPFVEPDNNGTSSFEENTTTTNHVALSSVAAAAAVDDDDDDAAAWQINDEAAFGRSSIGGGDDDDDD